MGADYSEARDPDSYKNLLISHIKMLQAQSVFSAARFVVIPENNLGFEAVHLSSEVTQTFNPDEVICFQEDMQKAGVKTDNRLKLGLALGFKRVLDTESVHFWGDFMSVAARTKNTSTFSRRLAEDDVRDDIVKEIGGFLRATKPQRDPTRPPTVQYTGKLYGGFDDMMIALMIANTCRKLFFANENYTQYH